MPTRLIHESLCTSESIARCSPQAQDAFPRMILYADNFGVFQIHPAVMKGRLWPLRGDVTPDDIEQWLKEYEQQRMLKTWEQDGKRYGHFVGWPKFQRLRPEYKRTHPEPPGDHPPLPDGDPPPSAAAGGDSGRTRGSVSVTVQSQSQEQLQSQSQRRDNGDLLKSRNGTDGYEADKVNAALQRLAAKLNGDALPILTRFLAGFGAHRPGPELLASEFKHLTDKIVAAKRDKTGRPITNLKAYAQKAIEKYHQERVRPNPGGQNDG